MSWSDANTEYRWHTPSSLVAVRRAERDQNRITSGRRCERARQQELTAKGDGIGQSSPPELSPAMSGTLLFGSDRKGRVRPRDSYCARCQIGARHARQFNTRLHDGFPRCRQQETECSPQFLEPTCAIGLQRWRAPCVLPRADMWSV